MDEQNYIVCVYDVNGATYFINHLIIMNAGQLGSKLFEFELRLQNKKYTFEQRKVYRLEKEKPILDAFWSWLDEQKPRKGSRFETAVKYAQNRKDTLMTYLEDGHCSFSNNLSGNAIRPFTVGRKNWLFSATPKGANASALVYTMVDE